MAEEEEGPGTADNPDTPSGKKVNKKSKQSKKSSDATEAAGGTDNVAKNDDGKETKEVDAASGMDQEWLESLDPSSLQDEDVDKLLKVLPADNADLPPDSKVANLVLQLSVAALRARDSQLTEALLAVENHKEAQETVKKEVKDLKAQVKKLRRVKEGQGGALEDLLAAEQDLELVS